MKSVMGASRALEVLARLMPSDAHKLMPDGSVKEVQLSELAVGDKVLVKPGEKLPADGAVVEGETSVNEAMGRVNGKQVKVVSPGYLREQNIVVNDKRIERLQAQGKTVVFTVINGTLEGAIALADIVRPES